MSTIVRTRIEEIREKEIYMGKWCFKNVFKYLFFFFFQNNLESFKVTIVTVSKLSLFQRFHF